ncbi:hypothetical protein TWF506_000066 [Arthrobotrys conoides]|uniref:Uncharacterized protein n=1 Tax=Arthrobotrys conoides TaxID=74498 RepID=A0AAN8S0M0_9PEZI
MASRSSSKTEFDKDLQAKPLPPPLPSSSSSSASSNSLPSKDNTTQPIPNWSSSKMTSRIPRALIPPSPPTASAAESSSLGVIPDIRVIEKKQQAVEELLDQGKVTESSVLVQEVARDLQAYREAMVLGREGPAPQSRDSHPRRGYQVVQGGTPQNTFVPFDELFSRAVDDEMKVDGEVDDLQLAGPQFQRLAKKLRVTAQVLEAVYKDSFEGAAAAQKDQYARYYHAFCSPACLNHRVFSPTEFKELGLCFQPGGSRGKEAG